MKKNILIVCALIIASSGLFAQLSSLNFEKFNPTRYRMEKIMSGYDAKNNIGKVRIADIQNGRNHLLTDMKNGRKLYMIAKREGRRVAVSGFAVQDHSGRWILLGDQAAGKGDPGFGCPDGWDAKIICYTHPTYDVQVCYTRCTPTHITLSLPPGL